MNTNSVFTPSSASTGLAKWSIFALLLVGLTACGGNKKPAEVAKDTVDITRPPQTIDGNVSQAPVQERSPDETISFDEWRKRRLQEIQEQQTP